MSAQRAMNKVLNRFLTKIPPLARRLGLATAGAPPDLPWAEPRVPLRESVVALVTTGGLHLRGQPPFDSFDPDGDASCREITVTAQREELRFTRSYYDQRDAEDDVNLVMPVPRLKEWVKAGALGRLHPVAYSLMGQLSGQSLRRLQDETAPEIARKLSAAGVDYALLVPV